MILDKIENHKLYNNLTPHIRKAFDYIQQTDFSKLEPGKYTIDGDAVFALVQQYTTKEKTDAKSESHFKYIDIQYVINGCECMGVTTLTNQTPVTINKTDDYALYETDCSFIKVNEGMFTIFFPDDIHMPCIKYEQQSQVKKVVIKVLV